MQPATYTARTYTIQSKLKGPQNVLFISASAEYVVTKHGNAMADKLG